MSNVSLQVVGKNHSPVDLKDFQEDLFKKYIEYCECLGFAPTTISAYPQYVRNALKELRLDYVWEITGEAIRKYNLILIERGLSHFHFQ